MRLHAWLILLFIFIAVPASAQTASYDYFNGSVALISTWTPILYVNGTAFPVTTPQTCTQAGTTTNCSFALPVISSAFIPGGSQTLELSLKDPVLGLEGPRSAPLIRPRPGAVTNLRFQ